MIFRNETYKNPILPGFNPDPSICRVGEDYYIVTSSFEYYPGVPIYHSKNLVNWELINYCLKDKKQLNIEHTKSSGGIFAPTIYYHDNMFFMATTDIDRGNFIVYSKDIYGTWSEPVWVEQAGIDPSLLFDEDGTVYFLTADSAGTDNRILLSVIDIFTGKKLKDTQVINSGCGGKYPEGPHLYKLFGKYYLMLAEGGTEYGHMETIQRADSPYGPYEQCPHNPILTHRNDMKGEIHGLGHADLLEDQNGNWWAVCLGFRPSCTKENKVMLHHIGRETFLCPVKWDENLWPVVGENGSVSLSMKGDLPNGPWRNQQLDFSDDFTKELLDIRYNFLRNPQLNNYWIKKNEKKLYLKGTNITLNDVASPTWIGIRQSGFCTSFSVTVGTENLNSEGRAGITAFYNESYHYDLYLKNVGGRTTVSLAKHIHDIYFVTEEVELEEETNKVRLQIDGDRVWYRFSYFDKDNTLHEIGRGLTIGLATESTNTMTFTGTFLAMFAERGTGYFQDLAMKVFDTEE